ncbi:MULTISPECIES: DUF5131 family protein [unclassified Psychrobacter]
MTGCTKVPAGCKYCYAEVMAKKLKAMGTLLFLESKCLKMRG